MGWEVQCGKKWTYYTYILQIGLIRIADDEGMIKENIQRVPEEGWMVVPHTVNKNWQKIKKVWSRKLEFWIGHLDFEMPIQAQN